MKNVTVLFLALLSLTVPLLAFVISSPIQGYGLSDEPSTLTAGQTTTYAFDLKTDGDGHISEEQIRKLLGLVADKDLDNDRRRHDYTYVERKERRKLGHDGNLKSIETETREVLTAYDQEIERLTTKNDQPLSEKESATEERRVQQIIDKRKHESQQEHDKRLAKEEKQRQKERKLVVEAADAYDFRLVGTELLNGRDTWVIEAEPRADYKPAFSEAAVLPYFRFRAWIDRSDLQLAKLDASCFRTAAFGGFILRIRKGTHFIIEQTRINDEVWLPKQVDTKIDMGLALLKQYNFEEGTSYRDYKKFRADSRILSFEAKSRD